MRKVLLLVFICCLASCKVMFDDNSNRTGIGDQDTDYDHPKLVVNSNTYNMKLSNCALVKGTGTIAYALLLEFTDPNSNYTDNFIRFKAKTNASPDFLLAQGTIQESVQITVGLDQACTYDFSTLDEDVVTLVWSTMSVSEDVFSGKGYIDIKKELSPSHDYSTVSGSITDQVQDVFPSQKIYFNCTNGIRRTPYY